MSRPLARTLFILVAFALVVVQHNQFVIARQQESAAFPLNSVERLELAKQLLQPVRQQVIANPTSSRRGEYTGQWVAIDANEVAQFILGNPLPENGIAYDIQAVRYLAQHPKLVSEDQLLLLLNTCQNFPRTALTAANSVSIDRPKLRQKIIGQALALLDSPTFGPHWFEAMTDLAELSENSRHKKDVNDAIERFYTIGKADRAWEQVKQVDPRPNVTLSFDRVKYMSQLLVRFAPDDQKSKYATGDTNSDSANDPTRFTFLYDSSLSDEEKRKRLHAFKFESFPTGAGLVPRVDSVSPLGLIALLDHELALKWTKTIDHPPSYLWARMLIAPAIAEHDPQMAREIIDDCFNQFPTLADNVIMSTPDIGTQLCAASLPIVEKVAPDFLPNCIEITLNTATMGLKSTRSSRQHALYQAMASVARYDREGAESLFNKYSGDVELSAAASFFRVFLVLYPHEVMGEYKDMPPADTNGIDYRTYVRNALLPALLEKDDAKAWLKLTEGYSPKINPKVLGLSD